MQYIRITLKYVGDACKDGEVGDACLSFVKNISSSSVSLKCKQLIMSYIIIDSGRAVMAVRLKVVCLHFVLCMVEFAYWA